MSRVRGRFNKPLWLAIAAQLACLMVGLWIHHRYVLSSLNRASEQKALSELESLARDAVAELDRASQSSPRTQTETVELIKQIEPLLQAVAADRLLIVDGDFQRLAARSGDRDELPIRWTATPGAADTENPTANQQSNSPVIHGSAELDGQQHLAVAHLLTAKDGYLVALRPSIELKSAADVVNRSLVYAGAIAFAWTAIVMGVASYLILGRLHDDHWRSNEESEAFALKRTEAMLRMREAVIFGLAKLTESRDPATGHHLERISLYSAQLALAMRRLPKFRNEVTPDFIQLIGLSSILHDIGKVGVEDAVLLKPGPFDEGERKRMQKHAVIGGKCLQDIERTLGSSNFLQMAREIAFCHHEYWNGGGYPIGLAGEAIPLSARIVAIVDVYEALSTVRVYKEAMPHDECVAYIRDQAGQQFDPDLVDVFLSVEPQIRRIAREFANELDENRVARKFEVELDGDDESVQEFAAELLSSAHAPSLPLSPADD